MSEKVVKAMRRTLKLLFGWDENLEWAGIKRGSGEIWANVWQRTLVPMPSSSERASIWRSTVRVSAGVVAVI